MSKICMKCGRIELDSEPECKSCHSKELEKLNSSATYGDYFILCKISKDPQFIKTMMELHDTDIVDYNLKLSQFKMQLGQIEQQMSNTQVHCPYCNSTDTKKSSSTSKVVNTAIWGIFGTKCHKNYHCNNCNSDF